MEPYGSPGQRCWELGLKWRQWRGMKCLGSGYIWRPRPWVLVTLCFSFLICKMIPTCPSHIINGESYCECFPNPQKHHYFNLNSHLHIISYFPNNSHHPDLCTQHNPGREVTRLLFFKKGEVKSLCGQTCSRQGRLQTLVADNLNKVVIAQDLSNLVSGKNRPHPQNSWGPKWRLQKSILSNPTT